MANIKSAIKRVDVNNKNREKNHGFKTAMRSAIKEFNQKADSKEVNEAKELFAIASKKVDKAASKNIIHKNVAAREKSRMQKRLNQIAQ